MSDRDAFLQAIRESPDDDTPRLVFADWLDEYGEADRAELIRLQIELEPVRDHIDDPRVRALADREEELLARNWDAWVGPAADLANDRPQFGPEFVRGFPESACVSLDTLLTRGGGLFAACPTLRELAVFGVAGRGRELEACPHLANVETLEIADWVRDDSPDLPVPPTSVVLKTYRYWLSGDTPIGLLEYGTRRGPRVLELVQLFGGVSAGRDAERVSEAADVSAVIINAVVKARLVRPFEQRFPLLGDVGHGFYAGHLPSGAATLAALTPDRRRVSLTTFDEDGRLSKTVWEERRAGEWSLPGLGDRFGFRPGLIRVREFATHTGISLRLWPAGYVNDYLRDPFAERPPRDPAAWRNRGGTVRLWLQRGRFVLVRGRDEYFADRRGKIYGG